MLQSALQCRCREALGAKGGRGVEDGRYAMAFYAANVALGNLYWAACLLPRTFDLLSWHMAFLVLQVWMGVCFIRTARLDPGTVRGPDSTAAYDSAVDAVARTGALPAALCHSCRVCRPPRSKHCRELRCCVRRYDHFCPFVGNAIGLHNQCWFLGVISSTALLCTFLFALSVLAARREGGRASLALVAGAFDFGLCGVLLLLFTGFHLLLISKNMTTNEYVIAGR